MTAQQLVAYSCYGKVFDKLFIFAKYVPLPLWNELSKHPLVSNNNTRRKQYFIRLSLNRQTFNTNIIIVVMFFCVCFVCIIF